MWQRGKVERLVPEELAGLSAALANTKRQVELKLSCAPVVSVIGESHPLGGRIRYRHQILNEIVPHMD